MIRRSPAFRAHFGDEIESFLAMVHGGGPAGDGGTDYLLNELCRQAGASRLPQLLHARLASLQKQFVLLLNEALPLSVDSESFRRGELASWRAALREAVSRFREAHAKADAAAHVSGQLRRLLNVEAELLEPIPLVADGPDWPDYIERQFVRWRNTQKGTDGDWLELGLKDAAVTSRHLGYLADYAMRHGGLARWLRESLGHLGEYAEAAHARRFLAIRMAQAVCFGIGACRLHRQFDGGQVTAPEVQAATIQPRLHGYAAREQCDSDKRLDEESPHYQGFIAPFLEHLQRVHDAPASPPELQPEDVELARLRREFEEPATP